MGFDESAWSDVVYSDPLWYANDMIWPEIDRLFVNPSKDMGAEDLKLKREILRFFALNLMEGKVKLGRRAEFFNDNDRWTKSAKWKVRVDKAVIHHTATDPRITYDLLNALGLLRLYCPIYMNNPAFQVNGRRQAISSGHLYAGRPTFVGYHHIVYDVGPFEGCSLRLLDPRYVGFHAGNYRVNCSSIGIAVVGNLNGRLPSKRTIEAINGLISRYSGITTILGHKEVEQVGGKTTDCPGDRWEEWKGEILPSR